MYISGVNQDLCPHAAHNESRLGVQALRVSILWERVASAQGARAPSDHAGAQRVPWEQSPVWDDGRIFCFPFAQHLLAHYRHPSFRSANLCPRSAVAFQGCSDGPYLRRETGYLLLLFMD